MSGMLLLLLLVVVVVMMMMMIQGRIQDLRSGQWRIQGAMVRLPAFGLIVNFSINFCAVLISFVS